MRFNLSPNEETPAATPSIDDHAMMDRAVRLALRGTGAVEPNPRVGCVIVDNATGAVLGEGWHRAYGEIHAEIDALRDLLVRRSLLDWPLPDLPVGSADGDGIPGKSGGISGDVPAGSARTNAIWKRIAEVLREHSGLLREATMFVTLEPCAHLGKTPACTDAIRLACPSRVVIGCHDPNPTAAGGADALAEHGIRVDVLAHAKAERLVRSFVHRQQSGRPWVLVKWAQTLDGRIATRTGHSRWISNAMSRRTVHRIRGRVDAILTGLGTVLADDPTLTARDVRRRRSGDRSLLRVVIDPDLDLPPDSNLIRTCHEAPLVICCGFEGRSLREEGASTARTEADLQRQSSPIAWIDGDLGIDAARDDAGSALLDPAEDPLRRRRYERLVRAIEEVGPSAARSVQIVGFRQSWEAAGAGPAGDEVGGLTQNSAASPEEGSTRTQPTDGPTPIAALPTMTADRTARTAALLDPCLRWLSSQREVTTVLVEAGGGLVGGLIRQRLVNELRVFIAPKIVGDVQAAAPARGLQIETMAGTLPLRLERVGYLGEDVELRYHVPAGTLTASGPNSST